MIENNQGWFNTLSSYIYTNTQKLEETVFDEYIKKFTKALEFGNGDDTNAYILTAIHICNEQILERSIRILNKTEECHRELERVQDLRFCHPKELALFRARADGFSACAVHKEAIGSILEIRMILELSFKSEKELLDLGIESGKIPKTLVNQILENIKKDHLTIKSDVRDSRYIHTIIRKIDIPKNILSNVIIEVNKIINNKEDL